MASAPCRAGRWEPMSAPTALYGFTPPVSDCPGSPVVAPRPIPTTNELSSLARGVDALRRGRHTTAARTDIARGGCTECGLRCGKRRRCTLRCTTARDGRHWLSARVVVLLDTDSGAAGRDERSVAQCTGCVAPHPRRLRPTNRRSLAGSERSTWRIVRECGIARSGSDLSAAAPRLGRPAHRARASGLGHCLSSRRCARAGPGHLHRRASCGRGGKTVVTRLDDARRDCVARERHAGEPCAPRTVAGVLAPAQSTDTAGCSNAGE
jgi:hypothetical protein